MTDQHTSAWDLYGSELSPFTLKLIALCDYAGLPYRFVPTDTAAAHSLKVLIRRKRLIKGQLPLTWPEITEEDEYPLVPFLFGPEQQNLYDSSAIAQWLDQHIAPQNRVSIPQDAALSFIVRLIDDYADDFGLYMVHHQRWKVSARSNNAGQRLAHEFRRLLGPLQRPFGAWFSARQVKRLPYLFSVAETRQRIRGLPPWRTPPAKNSFPATHARLEAAFDRLLRLLDTLLSQQAYVLGDRFSLADAAIYGQLGMNLEDPSTADHMQRTAPRLYTWLHKIKHREHLRGTGGEWQLTEHLRPLLAEICETYVPLMQQNYSAWRQWRALGQHDFNEAAFCRGEALYRGKLMGEAFCHVAKSFQAQTWRHCQQRWHALPSEQRQQLECLLPQSHGLETLEQNVELIP